MNSSQEKYMKLNVMMDEYADRDVMVAFSGGVDSSLLLKMACDSANKKGNKVYAVTLHTMLHPLKELENAQKVAKEVGAIHYIIQVNELQNAGILQNPPDRCYRCKKYLFEEVRKKAYELHVDTIMDGTNEDDLHVYRPGIRAIQELGIVSPLAKSGVTKGEVRQFAAEYGISASDRPSAPCLATRFPYGTVLSHEKMNMVEKGELFIKSLGIYNIRLRVHSDIVRIEVDAQDMNKILTHREEIITYLKTLGYVYITIDLEGFRSGSMDINLNL
ncbi:ATP-dependent sacrificial sulfur transferase LarE [Aminipila sp.]|uniref:ATP-dependent sacrificial sulfur transferase LarE n=1 Tax=Aminipila sp. TaxID=2060095 RepID=UPI00289967CE|nr:ATP-dependent sacrificial sulfur transferase LarE [Aminipila sp.]